MPGTPPAQKGQRVNEKIDLPTVRLVGIDGEMLGVVSIEEGLRLADEAGLDLVEVSPNADPPVCKILDYGKFKYVSQKKANLHASGRKRLTSRKSRCGPRSTSTTTTSRCGR